MKILIDADGCPVTYLAIRLAKKENIECIIICDTAHQIQKDGATTIVVSKGSDSVDFVLVNKVVSSDIVITQDYGLAAMCLSKKAIVLNQNGLIYTNENIDSLLMSRHINQKMRKAGQRTKGPSKRTKQEDEAFLKSLNSIFEKIKSNQDL